MDFNTVIFDGDVEWNAQTEEGMTYYAAFFTPTNTPNIPGTMTLTLNGETVTGHFESTFYAYIFPDTSNLVATVQELENSWMILSLNEADPHIKLEQENVESAEFFSGTITFTEDVSEVGKRGAFTSEVALTDGMKIFGQVDSEKVFGTVQNGSCQLNTYWIETHEGNECWLYTNAADTSYVTVDLEYSE